ncbi:MAG: NAD+ synthase [Pseudomonadota bacterium]
MTTDLKLSIVQANPTVGDLDGNTQLIRDAWMQAKDDGADLVVTTEFSLTGYPLEDLVEIKDFLRATDRKIEELKSLTEKGGPGLLVGGPFYDGDDPDSGKPVIYNAVFLIEKGVITDIVKKTHLPNYGVFDEKRNFTANPIEDVRPVKFRGHKLGVLICEDTWLSDVTAKLAERGAEILISINASPYEQGKFSKRLDGVVAKRVTETGLDLVYANQVGGQDELVFDGASFGLSYVEGKAPAVVYQAATLKEDQNLLTLKYSDGFLRLQAAPELMTPRPDADEELYQTLVLGTRDYIQKSGFTDVVLGLSGGIDSGLVAVVAVDALGPEHVHLVRLPSQYTSQMSNSDADQQAAFLGVEDIREIAISGCVDAVGTALAPSFEGLAENVTEENIQSRLRGLLLMALSNKFNWMLLTTGNKSEMSVGYCTLYGDTNGGFNPLKDVYKTTVRRLSAWRNENVPKGVLGPTEAQQDSAAGRPAIVMPWNIITRPPSAELRPDQQDNHSLPEYEELDDILSRRIEGAQSRNEIIAAGYPAETVDRILKLMKIAVYKQNQAPPGVKTTARTIRGKDLRLPIANKFNPADPGL